ncbi:MAG TPA: hypothetical protein VFQ42_03970 [Mycobacterium sp.]|nr:hypothetical protein [Mycobacterium sp.]
MTTPTPIPTPEPIPQLSEPSDPVAVPTVAATPVADNAHESFAAFLEEWLGKTELAKLFHLGELAKHAQAWVRHVRSGT